MIDMRILMTTLLLAILSGCGSNTGNGNSNNAKLNHNESEKPNTDVKSIWEVVQLNDEFGELTGDSVLLAVVDTKMTNSATSDGTAKVGVRLEKGELYMLFSDYGHSPANFSESAGNIKIRNDEGDKYVPIFAMKNIIYDKEGEVLRSIQDHGETKVHIDESKWAEYSSTTYTFTIPSLPNH